MSDAQLLVNTAYQNYMQYQEANNKPNSIRSFRYTLSRLDELFGDFDIREITAVDVKEFLDLVTEDCGQGTKNSRKGHISAFFNYVKDTWEYDDLDNPCENSLIKKMYRKPKRTPPEIIDKDLMDEIIYTVHGSNRLFLECMARAGMRIGEALAIRPRDLNHESNTIVLENPKSGRQGEVVYFQRKLFSRLVEYVTSNSIGSNSRIFNFSYSTGYRKISRLGDRFGIKIEPHDLRRFAATQASRAGMPLEMVSKIVLRHADLATTQLYLGTVTAVEASRAVEFYMA